MQRNRNDDKWLPSEYSCICSDHFKDEDKYLTKKGRLYLKKCAVPYTKSLSPTKSTISAPISESISSSDSIFDTPRKINLKKQLHKETKARKLFAEKYKKVQRQNRYLKKRCDSYKLLVTNLKEKFGFDSHIENNLLCKAEIVELHKSLQKKISRTDIRYCILHH